MNKMKEFFDLKAKNWDDHEKMSSLFFDNFAINNFSLNEGMKVIDLACGTGVITNSIFKLTHSEVLGIDLSTEMIKIATQKNKNPLIHFEVNDFYKSNYSGYDAIICHNAYPHFLDKVVFKNKAYSTLNKGGYLIICHSTSKEKINAIHAHHKDAISNKLIPADKEALNYIDLFEIISTKDDADEYVITLKKK